MRKNIRKEREKWPSRNMIKNHENHKRGKSCLLSLLESQLVMFIRSVARIYQRYVVIRRILI